MVALYAWLGWPAFTGLGVMLLLAPLNYVIMKNLTIKDREIMKLKDRRVKSLTEILGGIAIVKLFAWETQMSDRVAAVRAAEVASLKCYAYWLAVLMFLALLFANVVATVVFSVYAGVGHTLTAALVFPSLVLLENLTWPVLWLPAVISRATEAAVSLQRLNVFLRKDELPLPV